MEYISIRDVPNAPSFGGSQNWFALDGDRKEYRIHKWGCGLIAAADCFLWLAQTNDRYRTRHTSLVQKGPCKDTLSSYKLFVKALYKKYIMIIPRWGLWIGHLIWMMNRYFGEFEMDLQARWSLPLTSGRKLKTIKKSLQNNLPVILLIGRTRKEILTFRKNKIGLRFYDTPECRRLSKTGIKNHYVVVTDIVKNPETDGEVLRIASWGKPYFVDFSEYCQYIAKHGDPITSSMITITKRRDKK